MNNQFFKMVQKLKLIKINLHHPHPHRPHRPHHHRPHHHHLHRPHRSLLHLKFRK